MNNSRTIEWVLRVAVAGEFVGHGVIALLNLNPKWAGWVQYFLPVSHEAAVATLFWVGVMDLLVALLVLVKPIRIALLWAAIWGFWTALLRPIVGETIWDFIERWANWGAPLALLFLRGWPLAPREWLK
ncbi:MAG: hypothetical protein HYT40_00490 [Candidatus Sungbacteria bacterium]|uniref:DoxX family protein n=1 Tax=Candidatus Sungiibacteriota bacterium TaxID=2750080 RepID=A0A931WPD1_9BACT|nr:hypothetical protein [Candidatus Sungbacteria bacterium]